MQDMIENEQNQVNPETPESESSEVESKTEVALETEGVGTPAPESADEQPTSDDSVDDTSSKDETRPADTTDADTTSADTTGADLQAAGEAVETAPEQTPAFESTPEAAASPADSEPSHPESADTTPAISPAASPETGVETPVDPASAVPESVPANQGSAPSSAAPDAPSDPVATDGAPVIDAAAAEAAAAAAKAAADAAAAAELERIRPIWEDLEGRHKSREPFEATVLSVNRGGVVCEFQGVEVFVPQSHWSNKRGEQVDPTIVGQAFEMTVLEITQFDTDARRVTGSRRSLLRKEFVASLEPGMRLTGRVSSLTDFGAFVDLGGVDGLLHVSQISHARGASARDQLKKGEEIEVIVKKVEKGGKRISLGRKELLDSPWKGVAARYEVDSVRVGKVVSVTDLGAFVQLEPGVDGLVRPRELSWTKRIGSAGEVLSVGQNVTVMVTSVNEEDQRIGLSVRRTAENPWPGIVERFEDSSTEWEGTVKEVSAKGVVLAVDEVEGFLPRGRMGKESRRLTEMQPGEKLTVNVLEVDPKRPSVIFGIPGAGGGGGGGGRSGGGGGGGGRRGDRDRNFQAPPAQPSNEIKSSETVSNFSLGAMLEDAMKKQLGVEETKETKAPESKSAAPADLPSPSGESSDTTSEASSRTETTPSPSEDSSVSDSNAVEETSEEGSKQETGSDQTGASDEPDAAASTGDETTSR